MVLLHISMVFNHIFIRLVRLFVCIVVLHYLLHFLLLLFWYFFLFILPTKWSIRIRDSNYQFD